MWLVNNKVSIRVVALKSMDEPVAMMAIHEGAPANGLGRIIPGAQHTSGRARVLELSCDQRTSPLPMGKDKDQSNDCRAHVLDRTAHGSSPRAEDERDSPRNSSPMSNVHHAGSHAFELFVISLRDHSRWKCHAPGFHFRIECGSTPISLTCHLPRGRRPITQGRGGG